MKSILILLSSVALFAAVQSEAADPPPKLNNVEQRLREIDLTIALNQYEKLRAQLADLRFQRDLMGLETGEKSEHETIVRSTQQEALARRIDFFEHYTGELREKIRKMGSEAQSDQNKQPK